MDPLGSSAMASRQHEYICLWFTRDAQEAAAFYASTFPDSRVTAVHKAPSDFPSGKKSDALTVEFTVLGIPVLGLNVGPAFTQSAHAARAHRRDGCRGRAFGRIGRVGRRRS